MPIGRYIDILISAQYINYYYSLLKFHNPSLKIRLRADGESASLTQGVLPMSDWRTRRRAHRLQGRV